MPRSLLGIETGVSGPPCTISVPNLITDRPTSLVVWGAVLNVRRLMYQSLIWAGGLRDHARGLRPPLDAEDMQRAAHTLVDGMGGNAKFLGNFLGRKMLVDQLQTCELAAA